MTEEEATNIDNKKSLEKNDGFEDEDLEEYSNINSKSTIFPGNYPHRQSLLVKISILRDIPEELYALACSTRIILYKTKLNSKSRFNFSNDIEIPLPPFPSSSFSYYKNHFYTLSDSSGEELYYAGEVKQENAEPCLGQFRPFNLSIWTLEGNLALTIERQFPPRPRPNNNNECQEPVNGNQISPELPPSISNYKSENSEWVNEVTVTTRNGTVLGRICQRWGFTSGSYFEVFQGQENSLALLIMGVRSLSSIKNPGTAPSTTSTANPNKTQSKSWSWRLKNLTSRKFLIFLCEGNFQIIGAIREHFTYEEENPLEPINGKKKRRKREVTEGPGLEFPSELSPCIKALLIGAIFQLNYTYFETETSGYDILSIGVLIFVFIVVIPLIVLVFVIHFQKSEE